jgi:hypothetical protein
MELPVLKKLNKKINLIKELDYLDYDLYFCIAEYHDILKSSKNYIDIHEKAEKNCPDSLKRISLIWSVISRLSDEKNTGKQPFDLFRKLKNPMFNLSDDEKDYLKARNYKHHIIKFHQELFGDEIIVSQSSFEDVEEGKGEKQAEESDGSDGILVYIEKGEFQYNGETRERDMGIIEYKDDKVQISKPTTRKYKLLKSLLDGEMAGKFKTLDTVFSDIWLVKDLKNKKLTDPATMVNEKKTIIKGTLKEINSTLSNTECNFRLALVYRDKDKSNTSLKIEVTE